jgi:hypothetical protein
MLLLVTELPCYPAIINTDHIVRIERPDSHTDHAKLYFTDKSVMFTVSSFEDWMVFVATNHLPEPQTGP